MRTRAMSVAWKLIPSVIVLAGLVPCFSADHSEIPSNLGEREVAITIEAGVPLRLSVNDKTPIREGQPVLGVLTQPVYVFDREVLPAGTTVLGRIASVPSPTKKQRARVYVSGQLRIQKEPLIEFDTILMEDGQRIPITTAVALGVASLVRLSAPANEDSKEGAMGSAKKAVKRAVADNEVIRILKSGDKTESRTKRVTKEAGKAVHEKWRKVRNHFLTYWPFGTQSLASGTSFTAVLKEPVNFGVERVEVAKLQSLGSAPAVDSIVEARLLEAITSETAQVGSEVQAVITKPLWSAQGELVLPEGALLKGEVTRVKPARRFGRNGQLRFRLTRIEMPSGITRLVRGNLAAAEVDSRSQMSLDAEGGVNIPSSKKRFIGPAIAVVVQTASVPDDDGGPTVQGAAPGWSGFGLIGTVAALSAPAVAGPLGMWGAANSVYFGVIHKGRELEFPKDTLLEIQFGGLPSGEPLERPRPATQ